MSRVLISSRPWWARCAMHLVQHALSLDSTLRSAALTSLSINLEMFLIAISQCLTFVSRVHCNELFLFL